MSLSSLPSSLFLYSSNSAHSIRKASTKNTKVIHSHSLSSSYFCPECGCIYYTPSSSSVIISSLKPNSLNYKVEFEGTEVLSQMLSLLKSQEKLQLSNIYNENDIEQIRKKVINRMRIFIQKSKLSNSSLYLSIFILDTLIIKGNISSKNKIEQVALGSLLLSMKIVELFDVIPTVKQFQFSFENASNYSCEQLRKFEMVVLKRINYKLNFVTFITFIHLFLQNGILLSTDINQNSKANMNIYFFIYQICDIVIDNGIHYIQLDQFKLACAVTSLTREASHLEKWPPVFSLIYQTNFSKFEKEYYFISNIYKKKTEILKLKSKLTRNISYNQKSNHKILLNMKNKGLFNSNNSNNNQSSNTRLIQKIMKGKKLLSHSMEMTNGYSCRKLSNKKTISIEKRDVNRAKSITNNRITGNSKTKEEKGLSYRTITDTFSLISKGKNVDTVSLKERTKRKERKEKTLSSSFGKRERVVSRKSNEGIEQCRISKIVNLQKVIASSRKDGLESEFRKNRYCSFIKKNNVFIYKKSSNRKNYEP